MKSELKVFIDSAKKISYAHGTYNVYTVDVYNTLPDKSSFCFVISYIDSRGDYAYPTFPPYTFEIGNEIALLSIPKAYSTKWLNKKDFYIVDSLKLEIIKSKLANGIVMRHGETEKLLLWYDGHSVRKMFCRDVWRESSSMQRDCCFRINDFEGIKRSFTCDSLGRYDDSVKMHMKTIPIPSSFFNTK